MVRTVKEKRLKEWATIFGALSNQNRLKILKFLDQKNPMSVTELADELAISFKNTSRNLRILLNLNLVEYEGRQDRVYYSISSYLSEEVKSILRISLGMK